MSEITSINGRSIDSYRLAMAPYPYGSFIIYNSLDPKENGTYAFDRGVLIRQPNKGEIDRVIDAQAYIPRITFNGITKVEF